MIFNWNPPQAVWYHLDQSWYTMISEVEARRARKQRYLLRQATSHSSLLVARHGDVSRKLNQPFLLADSFNFNLVDEERSDIHR